LPLGFRARTTLAWTYGRGPNPVDASLGWVPLSRVPPLNGTVELDWSRAGFSLGGALRWAGLQNRLALSDFSDARIPAGGTPGYAVADLRASYRWGRRLALSAVLENLLDAPYRAHGSSVNGPGRSVVVSIETAPW
ncbi:MAG: TonB-dependent receptor domain-containing protein, partial [Myxococcaceae bacterium]